MKGKKGFTLIELIMVIVILGILAAVALPKFANMQDDAKKASEKGVVGGVRSGISVVYSKWLVDATNALDLDGDGASDDDYATSGFPLNLDGQGVGDTADLFEYVLNQPINADWTKQSAQGAATQDYDGPTGGTYSYTSADGKFE